MREYQYASLVHAMKPGKYADYKCKQPSFNKKKAMFQQKKKKKSYVKNPLAY